MNCFYHQDAPAIASCKSCARGLCATCGIDVGRGLACRDRCEEDVRALNDIIQRNRTSHEKTRSAYVRMAILYGMVGLVCLNAGLFNWRGFGWLLVPAALFFFFAAWLHYSAGRRFGQT